MGEGGGGDKERGGREEGQEREGGIKKGEEVEGGWEGERKRRETG